MRTRRVVAGLVLLASVTIMARPSPADTANLQVGFVDEHHGLWSLGTGAPFYFGVGGDLPLLCDWSADGIDTVGMFRSPTGKMHLRNTNELGVADIDVFFGIGGDLPICGDWNGDGADTIGVYRPSVATFYLRNSNTLGFADIEFVFGDGLGVPVAGDWDGDGVDTVGLWRPSARELAVADGHSSQIETELPLGQPGDQIVSGDWDGDGRDTAGVYRFSDGFVHLLGFGEQPGAPLDYWVGRRAGRVVAGVTTTVPPGGGSGSELWGAYVHPGDLDEALDKFDVINVNMGPTTESALLKARQKGKKVVLTLALGTDYTRPGDPKDGKPLFDEAAWKAAIDEYSHLDLDYWVAEGVLIGHYMIDEPFWEGHWGQDVPRYVLDEMARHSKSYWPTLTTYVRSSPSSLQGYDWQYLDSGWAMWERNGRGFWRYGPDLGPDPSYGERVRVKATPEQYIAWETAYQIANGHDPNKLIWSMAVLHGGDGSSGRHAWSQSYYIMSGEEIRDIGSQMIDAPGAALIVFRWDRYEETYWEYDPNHHTESTDFINATNEMLTYARTH